MKKNRQNTFLSFFPEGILTLGLFILSATSFAGNCNPYIQQLENGDVKFSVRYKVAPVYVEVFVKKNGGQYLAKNITTSKMSNSDGSFTFSCIEPAATYSAGTQIEARFYSHVNGVQTFIPGPGDQAWCEKFLYGTTSCEIYVALSGSDNSQGTLTNPVKTVAKGIELAKAYGAKQVRVGEGTYLIDRELVLANGISLLGGYSTDFSSRDISMESYKTTLKGPNGNTQYPGPRIIKADGIDQYTVIEGFEITNGVIQGYGGGIYVNNSNALLEIKNNRIVNNFATFSGARGGNIAAFNSSSSIHHNIIINGFTSIPQYGKDIYVEGSHGGLKTKVWNNVFTNAESIVNANDPSTGNPSGEFFNNYYYGQIVYVSTSGNDNNSGSVTSPVRTVKKGMSLAKFITSSEVRVAQGTYNEGDIKVENGVSLKGGYSSNFAERDISFRNYITTIRGNNGGTRESGPRILYITDITTPTLVEGLIVINGVTHGYGGGVFVNNSSANLEIRNNKIINNYATYYGGRGGNIALVNSAAKVHHNIITDGFAGITEYGKDMFITGANCQNFCTSVAKPEVYNNTFTSPSTVVGAENADFYNNNYLNTNSRLAIAEEETVQGSSLTATAFPTLVKTSTKVEVHLPRTADASLKIYNSNGILVAVLNEGTLEEGDHSFEWNASAERNGVYFYRLEVGNTVKTSRIYKQ